MNLSFNQWVFFFPLISGIFCSCDLTGYIDPFDFAEYQSFSNLFAITERMRIPCNVTVVSVAFGTQSQTGPQLVNGPIFQIWRPHPSFSGIFAHISDITHPNSTWRCSSSTFINVCSTAVRNLQACNSDVIAFELAPTVSATVAITNSKVGFTIYTTSTMPLPTLHTGFMQSFIQGSPYITLEVSSTSAAHCTPLPTTGPQGFVDFTFVGTRFRVTGHLVATGLTFTDSGFIREVRVGGSGSGVLAIDLWSPLGDGRYTLQPTSIQVEFTTNEPTIVESCLQTPVWYSASYIVGFRTLEGFVDIGATLSADWVQLYHYSDSPSASYFSTFGDWSPTASMSSPFIYLSTAKCTIQRSSSILTQSTYLISTSHEVSTSDSSFPSLMAENPLWSPLSSNFLTFSSFSLSTSSGEAFSSLVSASSTTKVLLTSSDVPTMISDSPILDSMEHPMSSVNISLPLPDSNSGLPVEAVIAIALVGFIAGVILTVIVLSTVFCAITSRNRKRNFQTASNVYFSADRILTESSTPLFAEVSSVASSPETVVMQSNPSYVICTDYFDSQVKKDSNSQEIVMLSNPSYNSVEHPTNHVINTMTPDDYTYDYVQPSEM